MSKDHWDNSFSEEDYVYGEEPNDFIREQAERLPEHARISAFAEGEGRNAVYLAGLGYKVTAYDQSEVGLQKACQLAERLNVRIETAAMDLTKEWVPAESADAAIMVFGHVPKKSQPFLFENLMQSVRPGGYLLFEVYSERQLEYGTGGPKEVKSLYDPADLLKWLGPHDILHFYYGEAVRHEGKRHTGTGHVIQGVIKKRMA